MLTDAQWAELEPLIEACRLKGKTPPQEFRRTISSIVWPHQNGAAWRAVPAELGPRWQAAQIFIRGARAGVWERLLDLVQSRGVALGMVLLDGTNIRAHQKAAGAAKKRRSGAERDDREALSRLILSSSKDTWRLWHQGLRDRRWARPPRRLPSRAPPGA